VRGRTARLSLAGRPRRWRKEVQFSIQPHEHCIDGLAAQISW